MRPSALLGFWGVSTFTFGFLQLLLAELFYFFSQFENIC